MEDEHVQGSLQREIRSWDNYGKTGQPPAPGMKQRGPGIVYLLAGAALGIVGAARVITLIPAAWAVITKECGTSASGSLERTQVAVAIVAGLAGVVCAEIGTRREGRHLVWLSMIGSITGIFAVLAGGALAFLLLMPGACG